MLVHFDSKLQVTAADTADIEAAVLAASKAFKGPWSRFNTSERRDLLQRLAFLVEKNLQELV